MKHTIILLLNATPQWLSLSRKERSQFFDNTVLPLFVKFGDKIKARLFDSEAFHARHSDFMIVECDDLKEYYYFIEHLRDTALFAKPFFELNDVIMGYENGFRDFEASN